MIRRIKLWWYRACLSGAVIDEITHHNKMQLSANRVAFYEAKIRALQQKGDPCP